jgi:hypothetical protein
MQFLLEQFKALRAEIEQRIGHEQQILSIALTAFGVLVTIALQTKSGLALFAYILLVPFLAAGWMHHHVRIRQGGTFIRHLEGELRLSSVLGWENFLGTREETGFRRMFGILAMGGVFLGSQFVALILALSLLGTQNITTRLLTSFAIIALVLTFLLVLAYQSRTMPHP